MKKPQTLFCDALSYILIFQDTRLRHKLIAQKIFAGFDGGNALSGRVGSG